MSQYPVVNLGPPGFRGLKVEVDRRFTEATIIRHFGLPYIDSTNLPPPFIPGVGGGIAWDVITERPYHSDGFTWLPIGGGAPGTVESYSQIKDGDQIIAPKTATIIGAWDIFASSTYHTIPGWNLATGIYTSADMEVLTIGANIAWSGGVSNLGDRTLRIQHFDFGTATTSTVKESVTQADPDLRVDTTQDASIHLRLGAGDRVFIEVFHNAPLPLTICGGDCTSLSGLRIQTT